MFGDLLVQHLDEMVHEAENKGGIEKIECAHFDKFDKVTMPRLACFPSHGRSRLPGTSA